MLTKYLMPIAILVITTQALSEQDQWELFKHKFNRSYKNVLEDRTRFSIFRDNLATIESHNRKYEAGLESYKMGVNQFTDMTKEEFVSRLTYNDFKRPRSGNIFQSPVNAEVPKEVNWDEAGAVTPVKDQGNCGSCWSFSTTGCLEGQHFIQKNVLISLSEQNLIDCSFEYGNMGCGGGLMDNAFAYVHANGIMSEKDYQYEADSGECRFNESKSIVKVASYVDIQKGSETDLKQAVASKGPISIAVDAVCFQFYSSGILKCTECRNDRYSLDHAILVTGYGTTENTGYGTTEDEMDYWLVKNSWGTSWGENGYIRMARNENNMCGVCTAASYAVLSNK